MMILALIGSPRRQGNTDLLVDEILRGAKERGSTTEKIYLYDYEIMPCIDCRGCKKGDLACVLDDGMREIYKKLQNADIIVFGTPVYWYGPSAKMKLLIDRLRPFIANGGLKGKRGVIVAPSEEGSSCGGPLMRMFYMSFEYLGMKSSGNIMVRAYERGEIAENFDEMQRAYEFGMSL
jgi:multimeric flavodoxin WrbA